MVTQNCRQCSASFVVRDEDLVFLAKMEMSNPTLCPDCRAQRRLAFRNERQLYRRKCDFTGEEMISLYHPDSPYKVYKEDVWWSDRWDPLSYGRDFDFSRPFFDQFKELYLAVPRRGMQQDGSNENCTYITYGMANKNCYLSFTCFYCEDVCYSTMLGFCKDSFDSYLGSESELLYETIDCEKCYACAYCTSCIACQDSFFLDDCRNCKNCIGCKNLRNKEYMVFNQQLTKEAYEEFKAKMMDGGWEQVRQEFEQWKLTQPFLCTRILNSENCVGDRISNAKDCYYSFDLIWGAENCSYCQTAGWKGKDMFDCSRAGKESELLYEMQATVTSHRAAFCSFCNEVSDSYYCDAVQSIDHCFGSIGLNHKRYCILNKQYSKEEYEALMPRIVEHMKKTGEWGEFFPVALSPFAFNETVANDFYPVSKEEALRRGWRWRESEPKPVTGDARTCKTCARAFKVIPQEKHFLEKMHLPQPELCPDCRAERRLRSTNPYRLWDRQCANCHKDIQSSYAPEKPEILYCEACYLKAVY